MMTDNIDPADTDLEHAADEAVRDVKRGAKRVGRALADGAQAVDDALRPGFGAQLADIARSLKDDPKRTPELAGDLFRDHPIACLLTAAAIGVGAAKLIGRARSS